MLCLKQLIFYNEIMSNQPLISVIIPVYNVEKYLPRCLDSVVKQTYTNLEIILVDDGSTDSCPKICDKYAQKDKRIFVIHQTNSGLPAARNSGMDHMHGEFFTFIDSDDWVTPDYCRILFDLIQKTQVDVSVGKALLVTDTCFIPSSVTKEYKILQTEEDLFCFTTQNDIACAKLYRSSLLKNLRFDPQFQVHEDFEFACRLNKKIHSLAYTKTFIYYHYYRKGSLSNNIYIEKQKKIIYLYQQVLQYCHTQKYTRATHLMTQSFSHYLTLFLIKFILYATKKEFVLDWNNLLLMVQQYKLYLRSAATNSKNKILFIHFLLFAPSFTAYLCRLPGLNSFLKYMYARRLEKITLSQTFVPFFPIKTFQHSYYLSKTGGTETVLKNWYRYIDKTKISFDFGICTNIDLDTDFLQEIASNGGHFLIGKTKTPQLMALHLVFLWKLYRKLKNYPYDIFQCHEYASFSLYSHCLIAKMAGIKKISMLVHSASKNTTSSGICLWLCKIRQFLISKMTDQRLAVSKKAGLTVYGDLPFTIIHCGIDTATFAYNENLRNKIRTQLFLCPNHFVVGCVARLSKEKNLLFLLDVFYHLYQQNPLARLLLVGTGSQEFSLRKRIKELDLSQAVLCVGKQLNPAPFYQAMDLFVLPSFFEGLPQVLLEAQASGLPCFVSDAVTREADTGLCTFLSLDLTAKEWAAKILMDFQSFHRTDGSVRVKSAGFDVHDTALQLEKIYTHLCINR